MKALACAECNAPHDFDLGPDDGTCVICGGPLIEDEQERELVGPKGVVKNLTDTMAQSLAALDHARGGPTRPKN